MPPHGLLRLLLALPLLASMVGCAGLRQEVRVASRLAAPPRGVVFVADGAGRFLTTSLTLREVVDEEGLPLVVDTFDWSHGYWRILADETDYEHARTQGQLLAARVATFRRANPAAEVYLLGHSAGTAVVLSAAESLPSGCVDRLILLLPAVSKNYDLRPALAASRCGIDSFSSRRDLGYLGAATAILGTADRRRDSAAGRVGFVPQVGEAGDAVLYEKLRQHPWHPSVAWTGNWGGHYGARQPGYLKAFVLPLLRRG